MPQGVSSLIRVVAVVRALGLLLCCATALVVVISANQGPVTPAMSEPTSAPASDTTVGCVPLGGGSVALVTYSSGDVGFADTYAYVNGNPINAWDPSGHRIEGMTPKQYQQHLAGQKVDWDETGGHEESTWRAIKQAEAAGPKWPPRAPSPETIMQVDAATFYGMAPGIKPDALAVFVEDDNPHDRHIFACSYAPSPYPEYCGLDHGDDVEVFDASEAERSNRSMLARLEAIAMLFAVAEVAVGLRAGLGWLATRGSTATGGRNGLTRLGGESYRSQGGLIYGPDPNPAFVSRVEHVMAHGADDLSRPVHGVFAGDPIALTDEAWALARQGGSVAMHQGSRTVHYVNMHRSIGYMGGQRGATAGNPSQSYVQLVTEGKNVITSFPVSGIPMG